MPIAVTHLCSTGSATDAVSYNMPSANYDANALILFSMNNTRVITPSTTINITGLTGATWELVDGFLFNTTAAPGSFASVYRTMVGTSQNAATLTASFNGSTQTGFVGVVDIVTGVATSGSNGADAIAQQSTYFRGVAVQTLSIGLASTPTNAVFGAFAKTVNSSMGIPTGFTELGNPGAATPNKRAMTCWNLTPVTSFASTQTAGANIAAMALEFRPQTSGGGGAAIYVSQRLLAGVGR